MVLKSINDVLRRRDEAAGIAVGVVGPAGKKIRPSNTQNNFTRDNTIFVPGDNSDFIAQGVVRQQEPIAEFNDEIANRHDFSRVRRNRDRYVVAVPIERQRRRTVQDV